MDQDSSQPRRISARGQVETRLVGNFRVSSPFVVQLAASHAGIGPYRAFFREGPDMAAARYRAADMSDRFRA